jgi:hypothetical protein
VVFVTIRLEEQVTGPKILFTTESRKTLRWSVWHADGPPGILIAAPWRGTKKVCFLALLHCHFRKQCISSWPQNRKLATVISTWAECTACHNWGWLESRRVLVRLRTSKCFTVPVQGPRVARNKTLKGSWKLKASLIQLIPKIVPLWAVHFCDVVRRQFWLCHTTLIEVLGSKIHPVLMHVNSKVILYEYNSFSSS